MNAGLEILLIAVVCTALVAYATVKIFRIATRALGVEQLVREGAVLGVNGLEFPRMFWAGTATVSYSDVESVEVVSQFRFLVSMLLLQYGISIRSIRTRWSGDVVVVKFKDAWPTEYLLLTPASPEAFARDLRARMAATGYPG
jgi:hypothetical protein